MHPVTHMPASPASRRADALRGCLLVPLIRQITSRGDAGALRELHEHRTPFRTTDGPPMSLVTFLTYLREAPWAWRLCSRDPVAVDRAFDLTLSKFLELPRAERRTPGKGIDCRRYYRGFLRVWDAWRQNHPADGLLEAEAAAAVLLQRCVLHQFRKSCAEVSRAANPARSRYTWRLSTGSIIVYMPTRVSGGRRRQWLQDHIADPDPLRPGERQRIQWIIDAHLGVPRHMPLAGREAERSADSRVRPQPISPFEVVITVEGLASAVADEKAGNLDRQRPKIRSLGATRLKRFILQAFQDLYADCYQEKRLAHQFRRSRAMVSRFAGTRWRTRPEALPPDLWVNVAEVLAAHDDFVAAAKAAGVWPRVRKVLVQAAATRQGRRPHAR